MWVFACFCPKTQWVFWVSEVIQFTVSVHVYSAGTIVSLLYDTTTYVWLAVLLFPHITSQQDWPNQGRSQEFAVGGTKEGVWG